MKPIRFLILPAGSIFIMATSLYIPAANAQSTANQINKSAGQAQSAAELIGGIKQLFGKKKKVSPDSAATDGKPRSYYFTGKISAKAKMIDCDEMYPFNRGAAVIKKGMAYALIDSAGNFVVPFDRFTGIEYDEKLRGTGFFHVVGRDAANHLKEYYINSQGKIVVDMDQYRQFQLNLSKDGKYITFKPINKLNTSNDGFAAIDYDGKRYLITVPKGTAISPQDGLSDSLFIYRVQSGTRYLYGCKDMNNCDIIPPSFDELLPFSDGVAVVGKRDDLGYISYGVIDKTGKLLIPPSFRRAPSSFHYGYALVRDAENTGFINKQGSFIYKFSRNMPGDFTNFIGRFAFSAHYVLSDQGDVVKSDNFFKLIGVNSGQYQGGTFEHDDQTRNGEVKFGVYNSSINTQYYGVYNVFTSNSLWGIFPSNYDLYRDPVSKLIHIKTESGKKDRFGAPVIIDGYVNIQGEFILVKGVTGKPQ